MESWRNTVSYGKNILKSSRIKAIEVNDIEKMKENDIGKVIMIIISENKNK